jgi:hypothetical protein
VPVPLDNTFAADAAELGMLRVTPSRAPADDRFALKPLLIGGMVGAAVALGGLGLWSSSERPEASTSNPPGAVDVEARPTSPSSPTADATSSPPPPVAVAAPAPVDAPPPQSNPGAASLGATAAPGAAPPASSSPPIEAGAEPKPSSRDATQAARLVESARASLLSNPRQAHRDAKAAYDLRRTQTALQLMGHAACRMGDEDKARWAHRRLRGEARQSLESSCLQLGIELD